MIMILIKRIMIMIINYNKKEINDDNNNDNTNDNK